MPKENQFGLDPVITKLTAPVTDIAVQKPIDDSTNRRRMSTGLTTLADSMSTLATKQQANAVHNDIITAELAAALDKQMPGFLEEEAQFHYHKAVDEIKVNKGIQKMKDFHSVEGLQILNDERMPIKDRATLFKNTLLGLSNGIKTGVDPANKAALYRDVDLTFGTLMNKANIIIAESKQQEALGVTSKALRAKIDNKVRFLEGLMPVYMGVWDESTPAQYAKKYKTFMADAVGKHINSTWFNELVVDISRTNTLNNEGDLKGSKIPDIKLTALNILGDELLKRTSKNPGLSNLLIMDNIINTVPGTAKGTTLRDDVDSETDLGKRVKTFLNDYKESQKAVLKKIEDDSDAAEKARNNEYSNAIINGMVLNDPKITHDTYKAYLIAITNTSEKRALKTLIDNYFSGEGTFETGSKPWVNLIARAKEFIKPNGELDEVAFMAEGSRMKIKVQALKDAVEQADPTTKLGKVRTRFFNDKVIDTTRKRFASTITSIMEDLGATKLLKQMVGDDGNIKDLNEVTRAAIKKKIKGRPNADLIMKILDAEILYDEYLETLVLRSGDSAPIREMVLEAKKFFDSEYTDILTGLPLGTTFKQNKHDEKATAISSAPSTASGTGGSQMSVNVNPIEAIVEQKDRPYVPLNITPTKAAATGATTFSSPSENRIEKLLKLHVGKGVLEGNPEAWREFEEQATKDVELRTQVYQELFEKGMEMEKADLGTRGRPYYRLLHEFKGIDPREIVNSEARHKLLPKRLQVQIRARKLAEGTAEPIKTMSTKVEEGTGVSHVRQTRDLKVRDKTFTMSEDDVVYKVIDGVKTRVESQVALDEGTSAVATKVWETFGKIIDLTGKGLEKAGESISNLAGGSDDKPVEKKVKPKKKPEKVSSVEPELSTAQKVASAVNTVVGTGTATVGAVETKDKSKMYPPPKNIKHHPSTEEIDRFVKAVDFAEGGKKAKTPLGMGHGSSKAVKTRVGGIKETKEWLNRRVQEWNSNKGRNLAFAKERNLLNPNPNYESAVGKDGKLTEPFLKWVAEQYAPASISKNKKFIKTLRNQEQIKNPNWFKNFKANYGKINELENIAKKESVFESLTNLSRKTLTEVVPDNLRFFASYLKDNKILSTSNKNPVVTEKALSSGVQSVLMTAVKKAIASGRTNVDYSDYPNTSFGMSVPALVFAKGRTKEEYKEAKERYPTGWLGKAKLLLDSSDDVVAAATTIGGFQFKIIDGDVVITDIYDFSKYGGAKDSAYAEVRKGVHTKKGNVVYNIKANLGKLA
tara:strand:+ start:21230 stop:25033 length:3804 start_codon:yes stop_codon:yes gene_type:complete